jgi:hypothetical protein
VEKRIWCKGCNEENSHGGINYNAKNCADCSENWPTFGNSVKKEIWCKGCNDKMIAVVFCAANGCAFPPKPPRQWMRLSPTAAPE